MNISEPVCLHQVFEAQVGYTPSAIAVVFEDEQLTYEELNAYANQVGRYLQALGVGPDIPVAICLERSLDMIISILAVLKAGGAYVPLDPDAPAERSAFMLADTQAPVLLTHSHLRHQFLAYSGEIVCLDTDKAKFQQNDSDNLTSAVTSHDLAYVIYTSGSTGQPKGVLIEHHSPLNLLAGLNQTIYSQHATRPLRATLNAPFFFDASVKQLLLLLQGHTLYLIPQTLRLDPAASVAYLKQNNIDVLDCTPAQLKLLLNAGLLDDDTETGPLAVLVGGEAIDEQLWGVLARSARPKFYNLYGPTECTVDATLSVIQEAYQKPTIGRPLINTQIYILDDNLRPVPVGVPGEIHIGGLGVGRGYLNRPELTAEKFIPDPFSDSPGNRLYKTGDLARYQPDGTIEFIGRADFQLKVRGFRIELGEIEATLAKHLAVADTIMVAREDALGVQQIVAYVVMQPSASNDVTIAELRQHLEIKLPEYMIPAAFVLLDKFPLNANGKVDRKALPQPDLEQSSRETAIVAPEGPVEEMVAELWQDILSLSEIGADHSFFALGGHSLAAMQVISRLKSEYEIDLSLRSLFEASTLAEFAVVVEEILLAEMEEG